MSVVIALLRGVNVTGNHMVQMEALRALCLALVCADVQTYLQSGNVVFRVREETTKQLTGLAGRIEDAIETAFGFRVPVVLRAASDLRAVVAANPFVKQAKDEPGRSRWSFFMGRRARRSGRVCRRWFFRRNNCGLVSAN